MSIWDEVKRSVDDISEVAKEVAGILAEKTDEISREGKLKLEIFNIQRQVRNQETKLGRRTFQLWKENQKSLPGKDDEAVGYLNTMKELHEKIEALQKELEASKAGEKGGGEEGEEG